MGASSPFVSFSVCSSALVDSASAGRKEVDSFCSASENFPGRLNANDAKITSSHARATNHLARGRPGRVKSQDTERHRTGA
jgi:hypothetical protein